MSAGMGEIVAAVPFRDEIMVFTKHGKIIIVRGDTLAGSGKSMVFMVDTSTLGDLLRR